MSTDYDYDDDESTGPNPRLVKVGIVVGALAILGGVVWFFTCEKRTRSSDHARQVSREEEEKIHNELFDFAFETLNRVERFDGGEMFHEAIDRLDQWVRSQKVPPDWHVDPMAAELLAGLGGLAGQVQPINDLVSKPRRLLEFKRLVRQFEDKPAEVKALIERRSLKDMNDFGRQLERTVKSIMGAMLQLSQMGLEDDFRKKVLEQFERRVQDRNKLTHFRELCEVTMLFDDPTRLRDLETLAQIEFCLSQLSKTRDRKELVELANVLESVATKEAQGRSLQLKLSVQVTFLLEQWDKLSALRDFLKLRQLRQYLDRLVAQLKDFAKLLGQPDLNELAYEIEQAARNMDAGKLQGLSDRLRTLAKPRDLEDLKKVAGQLRESSEKLKALAEKVLKYDQKSHLENLLGLAKYNRELAAQAIQLSKQMERPDKPKERVKLDLELEDLTSRFQGFANLIDQLARDTAVFAAVEKSSFPRSDGMMLQETIWLRDLTRWCRGEDVDDLGRAKRLFDWVVRNIQLDPQVSEGSVSATGHTLQMPWETLLLGQGTVLERAWVFILMARQQDLDVVLLAVPPEGNAAGGKLRPWALGVLSEGNIYLFDPLLGLPIPAPKGIHHDELTQAMEIKPATLAQVCADNSLLRQLDVDAEHVYPVTAAQAKKAVVLIEGSPAYLSLRMKLVEARLAGNQKMVLTTSPSALAQRLKATKQVGDIRLWILPYEAILDRARMGADAIRWQNKRLQPFQVGRTPALWKGRVLHLKGQWFNENGGAIDYYQLARPSNVELAALGEFDPRTRDIKLIAKQNASYWLGLVAMEQAAYESAEDYLVVRTLKAYPGGPWSFTAKYNLGRLHEVQGKIPQAVAQYRENTLAPDAHGELLRANWLEKVFGKAKPAAPAKPGSKDGKKDGKKKPAVDLPALPDLELPAPKK